jgi:hypothetical protein
MNRALFLLIHDVPQQGHGGRELVEIAVHVLC